MKRVLCVWFPAWPLQRLCVARPELSERAVVIHRAAARRGLLVAYCSSVAWRFGARPGMPLAEASGLAQLRAGKHADEEPLHLEAEDAAADREALVRLAEWCERYSPFVGIEESAPPIDAPRDTLLAEISGCAHLFGGEERLARKILRELRARRYDARVAVADTIGAAWALAHVSRDDFHAKPIAIAPAGATREWLAPLPVAALRLSPEVLDTLGELGLETIGQLEELERAALPARLGAEVLTRLDEALGRREEVIRPCRALPPLEVSWCFESPVDRRSAVDGAVSELLQRLAARLMERGQGVERLECRLYLSSGLELPVRIGAVRPRSAAAHWIELFRLRFESLRLPAPVVALGLKVLLAAPQPGEQQLLFGTETSLSGELGELLDRLAGRLGDSAVAIPRWQGDPQPERACRYEPATEQRRPKSAVVKKSRRARVSVAALAPLMPLARPLRLLARPRRAEVWMIVPDGPLARCRCGLFDELVARSWGPERIETGWWRASAARRDYYQIETRGGQRYWIFCRLSDRRWFVHGMFE